MPPGACVRASKDWIPWAVGGLGSAVIVRQAIGSRSLALLDLVVPPQVQLPAGVWGLGPELPRRGLFVVPIAWLSSFVPGGTVVAVALVAFLTVGFVGACRLVPAVPTLARLGSGALYAWSPFVLTRIGVGHLSVVLGAALLPWAMPVLLRPSDRLSRTWLWMVALSAAGIYGGLLAGALTVVGLAASRFRRGGWVVLALLGSQLTWLVSGVLVQALSVGQPVSVGSSSFATSARGPIGVLTLAGGHGFWAATEEAPGGVATALGGLIVVVLAALGYSRFTAQHGRRALAVALAGLGLTLASSLPGLRSVTARLTEMTVGAPFREGQRFLVLTLVWLAPAAAVGAARLAGSAGRFRPELALPLIVAFSLTLPAGAVLDQRLEPVRFGSEWEAARRAVLREPGTVLALPWTQYLDLPGADGRRVIHPIEQYFGGDVLSSSDPQFDIRPQEGADPREPTVLADLAQLDQGRPQSSAFADLGVRWVAVVRESGNDTARAEQLRSDPGLELVTSGPDLAMYRVRGWRGPGVDEDGRGVAISSPLAPLATFGTDRAVVWGRPASGGWLRAWSAGTPTSDGLLRFPEGSGPVWYWPALLVVGSYALVAAVTAVAIRRRRR